MFLLVILQYVFSNDVTALLDFRDVKNNRFPSLDSAGFFLGITAKLFPFICEFELSKMFSS